MILLGIDTGGTFTDFIYREGVSWRIHKTLSTPENPALAVLEGLLRIAGARKVQVVHGSTVATNALLEGKTARAALLITEGFEDILEIGRQTRPSLYDIEVQRPRALVPRALRFGIPERVLATGAVHRPLDTRAVRDAAEESLEL